MFWIYVVLFQIGIPAVIALMYTACDRGCYWMPVSKFRAFSIVLAMFWSMMWWVLITAALQHMI